MEDILASIRQIIADDNQTNSAQEIPDDDPIEALLNTASTNQVVEEAYPDDPPPAPKATAAAPAPALKEGADLVSNEYDENFELEVFSDLPGDDNSGALAFDEKLDLVMEASPADYAAETANVAPEPVKAETLDQKTDADAAQQQSRQDDKAIDSPLDEDTATTDSGKMKGIEERLAEIRAAMESQQDLPQSDDLAGALGSGENDDSVIADPAEPDAQAIMGEQPVATETTAAEPISAAQIDALIQGENLETEPADNEPPQTDALELSSITESEAGSELDLVKSLLSGLIDEPSTAEESAEGDISESEVFGRLGGDNNLASDEEDILPLNELAEQESEDQPQPEEDLSLPEKESIADIAASARKVAADPDILLDTPPPSEFELGDDEELILPERPALSSLAVASTTAAALTAPLVIPDVPPDEFSPMAEPGNDQIIAEQTKETGEEPSQPFTETPAEESDMPTAKKSDQLVDQEIDQLVDQEIDQEARDAFASLTSVVEEQADIRDTGPAIGDLVQAALKPMLKEWLDANLKTIVERAVAKEVKRISSGK